MDGTLRLDVELHIDAFCPYTEQGVREDRLMIKCRRFSREGCTAKKYRLCIVHDGGIMVQVAASQLTSSKLWSPLKPIALSPSKLPSPSM